MARMATKATYFNSRLYMRGNGLLPREVLSVIFQFTPLHERRLRFQYTPSLQKVFQFTPLHKRRLLTDTGKVIMKPISIHASTREATYGWKNAQKSVCIFQFSPLHERRPPITASCGVLALFQFMPLHERQPDYLELRPTERISIHASTQEATSPTPSSCQS